ncbi:MAG TPA: hypothetical protein VD969_06600 [Symbiobacteriaceae bacterium]|nr:hypothetical protein [Symbiobacteriaceae bacterium]
MKSPLRQTLWCAVLLLLTAGCSSKAPELMMPQLAPDAPAAAGLPPAPVGDAPTPLLDRPPFGLYAQYPGRDTLTTLSTARLSPDGRYRAAITDQGLWFARVDGAWLWQVPLPGAADPKPAQSPAQPAISQPVLPPQPGASPPGTAGQPKPPTGAKATKYVGPIDWTPRSTLLLRDDTGTWVEIDPEACKVTLLPQALQGKEWITYSPDRKQVMYYTPGKTGRQLWIAKADGTDARLQGENVTGFWGPDGKPVITKVQPAPGAATVQGSAAADLERQPGQHRQ